MKATYKGALKLKGIRATVYKEAEKHRAYYCPTRSQHIWYDKDDLKIAVFFKSEAEAGQFQTFLLQWHFNNPFVVEHDHVNVEEDISVEYFNHENDLRRILFSHYVPQESESPIQSLEQYDRSRASTPSQSTAEIVSADDPKVKYQRVEPPPQDLQYYKCHIKDFPNLE